MSTIDSASPADWDKVAGKHFYGGRKVPEFNNDSDWVNKPDHYNKGSIEAIEAIKASMHPQEFKGYLKGNVMKYLWRYEYKGKPVEDLRKAGWYLNKLIEENK